MKNKKRNTIIWLLTWAVLFLVVAYSPIGRPDLYVGTNYYINNQGVSFKGGIANAPKGTTYATSEEGESELTDYAPDAPDYDANIAGGSSEYSPQNGNGGSTNTSKTAGTNQATTQSAVSLGFGRSSGESAQGNAMQSNDVSSLSSNLTLTSSASTDRQASPSKSNGGRDEGGHNPKNPIPVGDGMWFLIIMAGGYVFWRYRRATKLKTVQNN